MLKRTERKTAGALYTEISNDIFEPVSAIDLQRGMQSNYLEQLELSVKHAKKQYDCSQLPGHQHCHKYPAFEGDFYIVVTTKREKLMDSVLRNSFLERQSCPTPQFDQAVYKYNSKDDLIQFLWVVPDEQTCLDFVNRKGNLHPDEYELANFIKDYYNGDLLRLAMKENGETTPSGLILDIIQ